MSHLLPSKIPPAPAMATVTDRSVLIDRGIATAIDLGLCYVLLELPLIYIASQAFPSAYEAIGPTGILLSLVFLLPIYITYSFVFEWQVSRTPGKVNRGLVVVMADGRPLTLWAAALRNFLRYIDFIGVPPFVLGVFSVLFAGGRRVGDLAAKTVVVRARAPDPPHFDAHGGAPANASEGPS